MARVQQSSLIAIFGQLSVEWRIHFRLTLSGFMSRRKWIGEICLKTDHARITGASNKLWKGTH